MTKDHCFVGDCRDTMRKLIADGVRVQMCVTSPPYFGLRDYGHAGQLGLEATPAEFVAAMVEVFGLVRELLADDGVLWLNLGDSYANDAKWGGSTGGKHVQALHGDSGIGRGKKATGMRPKNLLGIPWRVALALQEDGWNLRQDIIWHKPNPMPESVTDRCTKAHEYLFLLSKSERYYFDQKAIAEPLGAVSVERLVQDVESQRGSDRVPGKTNGNMKAVGGRRAAWNKTHKGTTAYEEGASEHRTKAGLVSFAERERAKVEAGDLEGTRNRRSVWTVPTAPYSGAHFATFPPALIEPCILAGSRPGDIVFDPFLGSGTTAQVAQALVRHWIGCELNPEYLELQVDRTRQRGLLLETA